MDQNPIPQGKYAFFACGGKVKDPQSFPSAVFKGERLFFCTPACLNAFETNTERFMAGEIEHPLDEE